MENQETKKSGSGCLKWFLFGTIGCVLLVLLCVCCTFGGLYLMFNAAVSKINDINIAAEFCNLNEDDLGTFYAENFTSDYKARVSYTEFEQMYEDNQDIFGACEDEVTNVKLTDVFKGTEFNYSNDNGDERIELSTKVNGKTLKMELEEVAGDWLIDDLQIND